MNRLPKSDALARIGEERRTLLDALAGLSDDELLERGVRPTPEPGQSCKDVMGHLMAWERRMIDQIHAALADDPAPTYPTAPKFNRQVFQENRDIPLAEIRAHFDASFERARELVESLSEDELARDGIWQLVAYNTYNHYAWASAAIRRWRRARKAT